MQISMILGTLALLLPLAVLVGMVVLQIFLSKREARWPGLILPLLAFLYSLMMLLSMAAFETMSAGEIAVQAAMVFLFSNIPTAVLLAIHFACREKSKRKKQLDKMNIADL